ncbi:PTS transporter subunit EIIC [Collinsella sp. AGMB00827]|uniref:Permease IIC component n=1 Tax=Collinsella ureilytica TaxID=2869515 RepID=A0ABS7MJF4_9ACTN|nr:PTS transporter subunit EIIC [Collinsella urealyticum]MBY4797505.1 PTS transporter subunit EIIC [Collinsella urealyticum]
MSSTKGQAFLDAFAEKSAKIGNQVHLRSLRDAFATIMPLFILVGIAVLVNAVLFDKIWGANGLAPNAELLTTLQYWGSAIASGTLNISALLLAGMIGYSLARNKRFDNAVACVVISIAAFVIMMPMTVTANLAAGSELITEKITTAEVGGVLSASNTGTQGMFGAITIGLLATTLFIKLSGIDKFAIRLGEGVPPAVEKSFNVLIPIMLTLGTFALAALLLNAIFATDLISLINTWIQAPLRSVVTSLPGLVFVYCLGTFLFTLGIHQSTVTGVLVEPILTIVLLENTTLFQAGQPIPVENYMNMDIINVFALSGGSGCTIALIIATFIWGKYKPSREVAKMSLLPGIFNINEPVIYGYPLVYNLPLMVPFVLCVAVNITVAYLATVAGIIAPCIAPVPWTTPLFLNSFLATGGDVAAVVLQVILLVVDVLLYLPFMKVSEKVFMKQASAESTSDEN